MASPGTSPRSAGPCRTQAFWRIARNWSPRRRRDTGPSGDTKPSSEISNCFGKLRLNAGHPPIAGVHQRPSSAGVPVIRRDTTKFPVSQTGNPFRTWPDYTASASTWLNNRPRQGVLRQATGNDVRGCGEGTCYDPHDGSARTPADGRGALARPAHGDPGADGWVSRRRGRRLAVVGQSRAPRRRSEGRRVGEAGGAGWGAQGG